MNRKTTLLLAVAAGVAGAACADRTSPPPTGGRGDAADQVLYGAGLIVTDRGVMRAELEADTAFFFDDNTRVELDKVQSTFFNQAGVKDAVLTSRHGRYNTRSGDMVAYGNVVVVNEAGRRLTTEELQYNQARNEFFSDSAFTMTEPGRELSGIGFRSDPDLNNVRVLRAASGFATGASTGSLGPAGPPADEGPARPPPDDEGPARPAPDDEGPARPPPDDEGPARPPPDDDSAREPQP